MSNISSFLSTVNAATNDLVGEFQEAVLARHAKGFNSGAILMGLCAKLKNEPADSPVFNWWERDPSTRTFYATSAVTGTTGTTIVFGASASDTVTAVYNMINLGDILFNDRTSESVYVTADASSNSVVVTRGNAGSTPVAINAGDRFTIVTRAATEGAIAARAQYQQPGINTNYIQSFNQTLEMSRLFKAAVTRIDSDGPLREARIQALERISNDIELAYLLGSPSVVASGQGNIYQTGGIKAVVDAYIAAGGDSANALNGSPNGTAGVSLAAVNAWFYSVLTRGSDAKLMLAGSKAYAAISQFANSNTGGYRTGVSDRVFGMNIQEILTPNGSVGLVSHPLLTEQPAFNDWAFIVDLQHVIQKVYRPLDIERNIQLPGQQTYREQFYASLGLRTKFPAAHGYATGLSKILTT